MQLRRRFILRVPVRDSFLLVNWDQRLILSASTMSLTTNFTSKYVSPTTASPAAPLSKSPAPVPTHKSMGGGIIAGVAIGGIAGLVFFITIIACCLKRMHHQPLLPRYQQDPAPHSAGRNFSIFSWRKRISISTIAPTPPPSPGVLPPMITVQRFEIGPSDSEKLREIPNSELQQPPAELGVACTDPACDCRLSNNNLGVANLIRSCVPRENDDENSTKSTYHDTVTSLDSNEPG
jgi:hypothetical protein